MIWDALRRAAAPPETVCPICESAGRLLAAPQRFRLELAAQRLFGHPMVAVATLTCRRCGRAFPHIERGPRKVIAYHGCRREFAEKLARGGVSVADWAESEKEYDWIGRGVYFWEDARGRAWQWARQRFPRNPAVVGAVVTLGECIDLADTEYTRLLGAAYRDIVDDYAAKHPPQPLPKNEPYPTRPGRPPDRDFKLRKLDRLVVDRLSEIARRTGVAVQTVRAPFEEGDDAYPGAKIRDQSHVQIAVRDKECIGPRIWLAPETRR